MHQRGVAGSPLFYAISAVLDNHTAAIHVGDQQPIQSQSTVTNGGNVQNSITYKDTAKLQVTPSVNDGGLVILDIDQSVTDVGPVDAVIGYPAAQLFGKKCQFAGGSAVWRVCCAGRIDSR